MNSLSSAKLKLISRGIALNPPASAEEISKLEQIIGSGLPNNVRDYYGIINGFKDGDIENRTSISLWSIERTIDMILKEKKADFIPIADILLDSEIIIIKSIDGYGKVYLQDRDDVIYSSISEMCNDVSGIGAAGNCSDTELR